MLTLRVEKPVAGGRMLARHEGAIVLVAGAVPGELVEVAVERTQRSTTWASTTRVIEASPYRVEFVGDEACGGNVYAHVAYEHQRTLKSQIIADAFARVGRMTLDASVPVRGSAVDGYRMRARLHVRDGRIGFFREGTHHLCDARPTRQLRDDTIEVVTQLEEVVRALPRAAVSEIELAENRTASERAVHLELAPDGDPSRLPSATTLPGLTGVSCSIGDGRRTQDLWGDPYVTDLLDIASVNGRHEQVRLTRHARAFFQGNRYLLDDLLAYVLNMVPEGPAVDLYAGVGLFAIPLAARRTGHVMAVEGDRVSAADLTRNAEPFGESVTVRVAAVESASAWTAGVGHDATIIVDPPRTGLSRAALDAVAETGAHRVVYVSCDVATLARDVRTLVDRGYRIASAEAFDLFPNTAHVETVLALERT
jgi:tRNA/tmRNA/rRNA uracil-C5-methylase (TrmA/RlmC/RlmD family)